jgi:hypothetical protein
MFNHKFMVPVSRAAHLTLASLLMLMGYAILTI